MAGNTNEPGRSVSSRLLAVLGCFDAARPSLTLTEIATTTGLPLTTTRRLLHELTEWGGLERMPDQRYRIGLRLWQLGSLAPQQRDLRESALPYMQQLYEATRENVQLVVLDGAGALCIEKLSSPKAVPTVTRVGRRLPLHATGVGKALLAHSATGVLHDVARAGLPQMTQNTITQPGRLAAALHDVRSRGVGYSYEEMTLGAVSVAAPILAEGALCGAVGIVTPSHGSLTRLVPAVQAAAAGIARRCAVQPRL